MDIRYKITVSVVRVATGEVELFEKSIPTAIQAVEPYLYDNFHILSSAYILGYFSQEVTDYLASNGLVDTDIEVDSYEIFSETPGVDVFFVNSDTSSEFTLSPTIKAYVHPESLPLTAPVLTGESYDSSTIIWRFEADEEKDFAHYILNEKGGLVAQLPIGVQHYSESGLTPDTLYARSLVKYDASRTSPGSGSVGVRTQSLSESLARHSYEVPVLENENPTLLPKVTERLDAFRSGVGDGKDLLVSKRTEDDFYERFGIIAKTFGTYGKNEKRYDQVGFNYRVLAKGKYDTEEQNGHCTLRFSAYPLGGVVFRIYKYASRPITIKYYVTCKVEYYEAGPFAGTYSAKQKWLTSPVYEHTLTPNVGYANGYAFLIPANGEVINDKTLTTIMQEVGYSDEGIRNSTRPAAYSGFVIYDDYGFDINPGTHYNHTFGRYFFPSGSGTVKLFANRDSDGYDPNNAFDPDGKVRISGFAEASLFEAEKRIERTLSAEDGENLSLLTAADLVMPLYNIVDSSEVYSGSDALTKVDVESHDAVIQLSGQSLDDEIIYRGTAVGVLKTIGLPFRFTDEDPATTIYFHEVLKGVSREPGQQYKFIIEVLDCSNNIEYMSSTKVVRGMEWRLIKSGNDAIHLYAEPVPMTKTWQDILPNEKTAQPLYGIVNGRFSSSNGYSGKEDMGVVLPQVVIPSEVYDTTFHILIQAVSPEGAFVTYAFQHANASGAGELNGDTVVFSSEATVNEYKEYRELVASSRFDGFELFDIKAKDFYLELPKPTTNRDYVRFDLEVATDNNDVILVQAPNQILFTEETAPVTIRAKGQQNATSSWNPRVHNGYYYANQREHFLYSEFVAEADYLAIQKYKEEYGHFSVRATLQKADKKAVQYNLQKVDRYDLLQEDETGIVYRDGFLYPAALIDTPYYQEYQDTDYISPPFVFPNIVTSYGAFAFDTLVPEGSGLDVEVRSYDFDRGMWNEWTPIVSGEVPSIQTSATVQFRANFRPVTTSTIKDSLTIHCSYPDFKENMDEALSRNISLKEDVIKTISGTSDGIYVSKVIDFGTESAMSLTRYNTNGELNYHLACSNNREELESSPNWTLVNDGIKVGGFRYFRYKLTIPPNEALNILYRQESTSFSESSVPAIGNFRVTGQFHPESELRTIQESFTFQIPFDGQWHGVMDSLSDAIEHSVLLAGYTMQDLTDIQITPNSDAVELKYNMITMPRDETAAMIEIFNSWDRFSHSGTSQPAKENEMAQWIYQAETDSVVCQINSDTYIGFVSDSRHDRYKHQATLFSVDGDDDVIGVVIAFHKDPLTGKESTLTALRSTGTMNGGISVGGQLAKWVVVYNFAQPDVKVIANGNALVQNAVGNGWGGLENGATVLIERDNNAVRAKTTEFNGVEILDSTLLSFSLDDDPVLYKFKGPQPYGYSCQSQNKSTFKNVSFFDIGALFTPIEAKGAEIKLDDGENSAYINFIDGTAVIHALPLQFCPIIVQDDEVGPLREVDFYNEEGELTLDFNQTFYSERQKAFPLRYTDYDPRTLHVQVEGTDRHDWLTKNQMLVFENVLPEGQMVTVSYRIQNSFVAHLDIENKTTAVVTHADKVITEARVMFETNERDNQRVIRNVSLNPIYNTEHQGFLFISDEEPVPTKITIHANPMSVIGDGKDGLNVHVELTDIYDNPVSGETLEVTAVLGGLSCKDFVTDANGVISMRYTSGIGKGMDALTAKCAVYNLETEINIKNR